MLTAAPRADIVSAIVHIAQLLPLRFKH